MYKQYRATLLFIVTFISFLGLFYYYYFHYGPGSSTNPTLVQPSIKDDPNLINPHHLQWKNKTRANAAFVILTRNGELETLRKTIQQLEARFNHKFNYPYVFLNDVEFTQEFKELTSSMTSSKTEYGLIPKEHWSYPDWIDIPKADEARRKMAEAGIIYGDSLSYRHMCRFNSGFFYRHPLVEKYEYYWRVEPGVEFMCDIDYDPFLYMKENNKKYGWTISLIEYESTIPTLWKTVVSFMQKYPQYIPKNNLLDFISYDGGRSYNLCHFWSNFEIADLKFLRSPEYSAFFDYLDKTGGFFYERWGDAPVHSIAAGIFLNKSEVYFFNNIGYRHEPFEHCPLARELQKKCHCSAEDSFDNTPHSCLRRWMEIS
ncbi:alpha 1,2-mannosyltransferase 2.4.1 [Rhizopus azygosporus]|uniref:Alpha 1,2-mannosyltransferase 2.4.1 n=1 Tax=Rhizopus azygosporus TaxID=86630 RepID=A0A367KB94_RHIAZ|nr:alpha 1,2-mannosyltransferase 2.4.1 [Rhizopus azygosporus]